MKLIQTKAARTLAIGIAALTIAACSSDSPDVVTGPPLPPAADTAFYFVTVKNLTNAQPLSPVAFIAHQDGYSVFTIGAPAGAGLEVLAEGGDNSLLIAEANADALVSTTVSGAAPIGPAGFENLSVFVPSSDLPGLQASISTMLVNTNDAITGVDDVAIGRMQVGDVLTLRTIAYDAGTEANTEAAAHIPGPAGGGEGFNAARDDSADRVAMHSGVVSQDDGFATSDLSGQHRFDNPVAEVRIERIN